jgi:hypothetical protein
MGAVTATQTIGLSGDASVRAGNHVNAVAYLNIAAMSGTSAGLAVQFQDSPDGTIWTNVPSGSITSQTVRAVQTVVGTTPSITYDLKCRALAVPGSWATVGSPR